MSVPWFLGLYLADLADVANFLNLQRQIYRRAMQGLKTTRAWQGILFESELLDFANPKDIFLYLGHARTHDKSQSKHACART